MKKLGFLLNEVLYRIYLFIHKERKSNVQRIYTLLMKLKMKFANDWIVKDAGYRMINLACSVLICFFITNQDGLKIE